MSQEVYIIPKAFVIFRTPGVVATVPDPPTLRKSHKDFKDTDLELNGWAKNIPDRKVFFRNESGIITFDDDSGEIITDHAGLSNLDYASSGHTGFASLVAGKVPAAELPSYVDDIVDSHIVGGTPFASDWLSLTAGGAALTPEAGKIYVVLTAGAYVNKAYRYSGSVFVEVSPSTVPNAITTTNFWFGEEGGYLVAKVGSNVVMRLSQTGKLDTEDDVEPFAAI